MILGGKVSPGMAPADPMAPINPKAMLGMLPIAPRISGGSLIQQSGFASKGLMRLRTYDKPGGSGPSKEEGEGALPESSEPGDLGKENDTAYLCRLVMIE